MAGETWLSSFQIGEESVYGTGVAATRKMYYTPESVLSREQEQRVHRFQVGRRSNALDATNGPQVAGGRVIQPLDSTEIIELLLMTLQGNVSPSTPGGATNTRLWTFVDSATLDSGTLEWYDGARGWELNGVYGNQLRFAGSANGPATVECDLFGTQMTQQTITAALTDRTPTYTEGWETSLYVDSFGGTPGSTAIAAAQSIVNWAVTIDNQLGRKYLAANSNAMQRAVMGELNVTASMTIEASGAQALTEFNSWIGETKRLVRLEFGQNDVIETTFKRFVTIDLPGMWSAVDLGPTDQGTRVYECNFTALYDPTNAFQVQVRAQNARTSAWTN